MIILACATEIECKNALNRVCPEPEIWPATVHHENLDFLVCPVGVGPVAAALSIGTLLERFPAARGIVNLGICGGFDLERTPLGGVCLATAEIWPEYGLHCATNDPEAFSHQMFADLPLIPVNRIDLDPDEAARAMGLTLAPEWARGTSLTVAGVSATPERATTLRTRFDAITENMEGFGLALAARRKGIAFLEVRTVSNPVGARDKGLWNFRLALRALGDVLPRLAGGSA
jgi:futalosine hydrolase